MTWEISRFSFTTQFSFNTGKQNARHKIELIMSIQLCFFLFWLILGEII